ncbi:MAG: L-threonylcarbamoyladenylate synthase, partial [Syntrophomonas sp.]
MKVDAAKPEAEIIDQAAQFIKNRELVAFPTETVYGLGAGAFSPSAVEKIFLAKGRPAANPLLVHVSNLEQVGEIAREITPPARILMDNFWPGPLSIILPARDNVPEIVRGGKDSVGLRMPDHPVALALIEQTGPLAAPSANLSGRPSPLSAEHVKTDLDGRIAAVLDAGATGLGVESTILDLSGGPFRVLRRGGVAVEELEKAIDEKIEVDIAAGGKFVHYQTSTQVILCKNRKEFENKLNQFQPEIKVGVVLYDDNQINLNNFMGNGRELKVYELDLSCPNSRLYSILRDAEESQLVFLIFAPLPQDLGGLARSLADRIKQAAAKENGREV